MPHPLSILILYTGGTIGMVKDSESDALKPLDFKHIEEEIPELRKFDHDLSWLGMEPILDSSNIQPENWIHLARIIVDRFHEYDGFVVLHGTDTLAYSASALSFILQGLQKPIIFTGSQLPIGLIRTDGRENLISAIEMAAARDGKEPMVPGVGIYFENQLFQGNRTTKYSAEDFNAFVSPNYPVLAESGVHLKFNKKAIYRPSANSELQFYDRLCTDAGILKLFPGIPESVVSAFLNGNRLKAVVLETYGSGNAPMQDWFLEHLRVFIENGGIVLNVTQCLAGRVEQGRYETSQTLKEVGVVGGADITTEAAITKLMHLLGQNYDHEQLRFFLNTSISGEFN